MAYRPSGSNSLPHGKCRSASRILPFGLCGKTYIPPLACRYGVAPGHVDYGVMEPSIDAGSGSFRMAPARTKDLAPPRRGSNRSGNGVVIGEQAGENERPAV